MNWDEVIKKVSPYLVKVETPNGHGSGFVCAYNASRSLVAVATAYHVVADADDWQQPIRIYRYDFKNSTFLKESDRVIYTEPKNDSAVVLFPNPLKFELPEDLVPLRPISAPLDIGAEVGWLGFPSLEPWTACFFSGNISARRQDRNAYMLDGVAISGVSGGPVLYSSGTEGVQFVGMITAYRASRQQGDALPGLSVAQDVSPFHQIVQNIRTMDEAAKKRAEEEAAKKVAPQADAQRPPEPPGQAQ